MDIQIENLTRKELVELHDRVARRIWELEEEKPSENLREFQIGNLVSFELEGRIITGTVIGMNRKTLSVRSQHGYWYVPSWAVAKISCAEINSA